MLTVANGTLSFAVSLRPQLGADRADREVGREQRREEHQLAGEPDDRADADHARPVVVPVQTGGRDRRCCRHGAHYVVSGRRGPPRPPVFRGHQVHTRASTRAPGAAPRTPSEALPSFTLGRVLHGLGARPGPVRADRLGGRALPLGVRRPAPPRRPLAASAGRCRFVVLRDGRRSSSPPSSGLAAYDTTLLSVHMVQHMMLSMVVPLALALGAPVTLALRTLPRDAAAAGCWRCCTPGWRRCCPSRR